MNDPHKTDDGCDNPNADDPAKWPTRRPCNCPADDPCVDCVPF